MMKEYTVNEMEELQLPGFRFHPTEEELLDFYLKKFVLGKKNACFQIIRLLNIYLYDPWILPELSKVGEREWYFFVPRNRKHGSGNRPNQTTKNGFWKATGSDRKIFALSDTKKHLGFKKTLVFYGGRAPGGNKTDWIMTEYRLPDSFPSSKEMVLCKIYRKATSMKVLEQRAAMEEAPNSITSQRLELVAPPAENTNRLNLPAGMEKVSELCLPISNMDWNQDAQLRSPWLHNLIFTPSPCANILNFFD